MSPLWGRITQKTGTIYLHVFDWPRDGKLVGADMRDKVAVANGTAACGCGI